MTRAPEKTWICPHWLDFARGDTLKDTVDDVGQYWAITMAPEPNGY
jgi:hypothetical protein